MTRVKEIFGSLVFNEAVMKERLKPGIFSKVVHSRRNWEKLEKEVIEEIAYAMKEWALENGATHYTHWFQPQRNGVAEKHDAFISFNGDGEVIEKFTAKQLIQSEPDGSSFPSGGLRATSYARGYAVWDMTSYAFLNDNGKTKTLVVPAVFISWTGEVLDLKTPLLRSIKAVNNAVIPLQELLGNKESKNVTVYAGLEQEYFLIPEEKFYSRDDLRVCNRTLFGALPAKGQQMEDYYFAPLSDRVIKFMEDFDMELYRIGIPAKTRHYEVCPNQFEIAPIFEEANIAVDHNLQLMDILGKVAKRHHFVAVLHEKPFAGLNGSGKHLNWSIGDNIDNNYLEVDNGKQNKLNFVMTLSALFIGLSKYGGLLAAAVADSGNDYRRGEKEAPNYAVSVYLGDILTNLLDQYEKGNVCIENDRVCLNILPDYLPTVLKDISDRNRTTPIGFTGDKCEFRSPGSSQNCSEFLTNINIIAAYGFKTIYDRVKAKSGKVEDNIVLVLREILSETKAILYNGDNYSDEWKAQVKGRGIESYANAPEAIGAYLKPEIWELFSKLNILEENEIKAKAEIKYDTYTKLKKIEYLTALDISRSKVLPAIGRHINNIASAAANLKEIDNNNIFAEQTKRAYEVCVQISKAAELLESQINKYEESNMIDRANAYVKECEVALEALRNYIDIAECLVEDSLWPLKKYSELLSIE